MRTKLEWDEEVIDNWTSRFKVYGGWIVTIENPKKNSITSQFILDRNHEWVITNLPHNDGE
jgi:hypothetical protein